MNRVSGIGIRIKKIKKSLKKMHLKMSSAKWRPFCPGLIANALKHGLSWINFFKRNEGTFDDIRLWDTVLFVNIYFIFSNHRLFSDDVYFIDCIWKECEYQHTTTNYHHIWEYWLIGWFSLQWHNNGRDGFSNPQPHHCLLNVYSGADQRKHQSSAFVREIHRWPVDSPQNGQ